MSRNNDYDYDDHDVVGDILESKLEYDLIDNLTSPKNKHSGNLLADFVVYSRHKSKMRSQKRARNVQNVKSDPFIDAIVYLSVFLAFISLFIAGKMIFSQGLIEAFFFEVKAMVFIIFIVGVLIGVHTHKEHKTTKEKEETKRIAEIERRNKEGLPYDDFL